MQILIRYGEVYFNLNSSAIEKQKEKTPKTSLLKLGFKDLDFVCNNVDETSTKHESGAVFAAGLRRILLRKEAAQAAEAPPARGEARSVDRQLYDSQGSPFAAEGDPARRGKRQQCRRSHRRQ